MTGIIFGGNSFEHEISIVSAIALKSVLRDDLRFVFCDLERKFYLIEPQNMRATYFSKGEYKGAKELNLAQGGFFTRGIFGDKKIEADFYINLIHGRDGEDGKMAALLDFFDVRYIGPRLESSAVSFNKILTKFLAKNAGVKSLAYEIITRENPPKMDAPIIIKPAHLGSSIGISVVKDSAELEYALDLAFEFDSEAIVEPFISGVKEYNLAGCKIKDEMVYSIVEEPKKIEILDFKQKYMRFSGDEKVKEAEISDELKQKMREAFARIYAQGFDGALIRCDFFVINDEVYLNEINPNPGSLANYLFDDFNDVISRLSRSLPREKKIPVNYEFINQISSNK
jgi:hypothetical protein